MNIERLNELAASIREVGLLEPIIVRPVGKGAYEVVAGEGAIGLRSKLACERFQQLLGNTATTKLFN